MGGAGSPEDWTLVLERLLEGDRVAFAKFNRLVSGFLRQLRAYDFEDEWDDLRQEVLLATVANARAGRLRDPKAFVGYVKIITRNKFVDRLKRSTKAGEKGTLPWDDETARAGVALSGRISVGGAFGDNDNDGDPDLYVTAIGEPRYYLFINDGTGVFSEEAVTRGAAVQSA